MITKDGTQIYHKVWGKGQPMVFSHGWPLIPHAWEDQMSFPASRGYRCIAHDRSSQIDENLRASTMGGTDLTNH